MTATEPQTAEPKSKRPWYRRTSVWFELVFGLLVLTGFLFACMKFRWLIDNEQGRTGLAAWAGLIVALFVYRHRPVQPLSWYCHGILGVYLVVLGITLSRDRYGNQAPYLWVLFYVSAGLCFAITALNFFEAHQQFTLRTLMLVTLGVAVLCSVSRYVPIATLIFLGLPAFAWTMPGRGPPPLRRGKDGLKDLKSEISDPESQIQNPQSKI
jgi:hypothetical protein